MSEQSGAGRPCVARNAGDRSRQWKFVRIAWGPTRKPVQTAPLPMNSFATEASNSSRKRGRARATSCQFDTTLWGITRCGSPRTTSVTANETPWKGGVPVTWIRRASVGKTSVYQLGLWAIPAAV